MIPLPGTITGIRRSAEQGVVIGPDCPCNDGHAGHSGVCQSPSLHKPQALVYFETPAPPPDVLTDYRPEREIAAVRAEYLLPQPVEADVHQPGDIDTLMSPDEIDAYVARALVFASTHRKPHEICTLPHGGCPLDAMP